MNFGRVCIAGLGEVGLPTARYIAERGLNLVGYDINPLKVELAQRQGLDAKSEWTEVGDVDAYVICVNTGWTRGSPDFSSLSDLASKIQRTAKRHHLISVESTVTPGTSRMIFDDHVSNFQHVVHVPHRYWSGDPVNHGVRQQRVIGAIDGVSLEIGIEFYQEHLDIPVHVVEGIELAEMTKVVENASRFVSIAFAEEVRMMCDSLGLDFSSLREACNTKWNIEILEARDGIGGHCLEKDAKYLGHLGQAHRHIVEAAKEADTVYKDWLSKFSPGENSS